MSINGFQYKKHIIDALFEQRTILQIQEWVYIITLAQLKQLVRHLHETKHSYVQVPILSSEEMFWTVLWSSSHQFAHKWRTKQTLILLYNYLHKLCMYQLKDFFYNISGYVWKWNKNWNGLTINPLFSSTTLSYLSSCGSIAQRENKTDTAF